MLETKHVTCEFLKALTEAGTFEGWLAVYGNLDEVGDIIEPGAFQKNLREKGNERPLLWQHQSHNPIGTLKLEERPEGLWAKGKLILSIPDAQRALELMKANIVRGLSIGYTTIRKDFVDGIRHLKELVLHEGSAVTFPANELALISGVKSLDHGRVQLALKSFRDDILQQLKGTYS